MAEDVFLYDEVSRNHKLNGISIPSITQILKPLNDFSGVPDKVLGNASFFGTAVHKVIELYMKGTLDEDSIDVGLRLPLEGFKNWYCRHSETLGYIPAESKGIVEVPAYNKKLWYCGRPDIVFDEAIIEIKTRKFKPTTDPLQLIAQKNLFPDFPHKKLYVLEIDVEGNINLVNAERNQAWGVFRKMIDFHYEQIKFNKLLESWKGV
jgi:hypothetical protein